MAHSVPCLPNNLNIKSASHAYKKYKKKIRSIKFGLELKSINYRCKFKNRVFFLLIKFKQIIKMLWRSQSVVHCVLQFSMLGTGWLDQVDLSFVCFRFVFLVSTTFCVATDDNAAKPFMMMSFRSFKHKLWQKFCLFLFKNNFKSFCIATETLFLTLSNFRHF